MAILSWNVSALSQDNLHLRLSSMPQEWDAVCFQEFEAGLGYERSDEKTEGFAIGGHCLFLAEENSPIRWQTASIVAARKMGQDGHRASVCAWPNRGPKSQPSVRPPFHLPHVGKKGRR